MSDTKKCPYCAEEVQAAAIKCKHCGSSLAQSEIHKEAAQAQSVADSIKYAASRVLRRIFQYVVGLAIMVTAIIVILKMTIGDNSSDPQKSIQASSVPKAISSNQRPTADIDLADSLNEKCHGSGDDPATEAACDKRDEVISRIEKQGWCYGHESQAMFEREWEPCLSPGSQPKQSAAQAVPAKKEKPIDLNDASVLDDKYGIDSMVRCSGDVDDYLRTVAKYDFKWDDDTKGLFEYKFQSYLKNVPSTGVLVSVSDKVALQNGYGAYQHIKILCYYDTQSKKVLKFEIGER